MKLKDLSYSKLIEKLDNRKIELWQQLKWLHTDRLYTALLNELGRR